MQMAKILKYTVHIADCEYSFYIKTCIRNGTQAYKVVKCCNWYTLKHGVAREETHEVNKEVAMGIYSTLAEAEAELDSQLYRYTQRTLTASN